MGWKNLPWNIKIRGVVDVATQHHRRTYFDRKEQASLLRMTVRKADRGLYLV